VNRQAARKQANREENGNLQNVFGCRATDALSNIKEIRDDKDCEDRRLRGDQAIHPYAAPVREIPHGLQFWDGDVYRTH
jgi:hypothetical protein